jgi:uncharacterized membrane protein YuzA (DUF378 family)
MHPQGASAVSATISVLNKYVIGLVEFQLLPSLVGIEKTFLF